MNEYVVLWVIAWRLVSGLSFSDCDGSRIASFTSAHRRSFVTAGAHAAVALTAWGALTPTAHATGASPPPPPMLVPLQPPPGSTAPLTRLPGGVAPFRPVIVGDGWDPPFLLSTKLGQNRILATEQQPLQQYLPFSDQELYYAPFLFGAWNVSATLKRKVFPYGTEYVPSQTLIEGSPRNRNESVGNTCRYTVHYFSTLANTLKNQLTVQLGTGVPESKIIQDRAYNAVSISNAYQQLTPVQNVIWDYAKDPTKIVLEFGPGLLTEDLQPLGPRRTEIFFTARQSEQTIDHNNGDEEDGATGNGVFAGAEKSRSVTLAPGNVIVMDTETATEFRARSEDHVQAVSRVSVFLSPNPNSREGVLWQQVNGKAVALFDYELDMHRIKESFTLGDGSILERACVTTPKDFVQCY